MIDQLIAKIREKKELQGVSKEYIETLLAPYVKKNISLNKKDEKILITTIRSQLRKATGRYHAKGGKVHVSTAERSEFYPLLHEKIRSLHPTSILDLGSGQNPLFQATPDIYYYAYDVNEHDLALVKEHFRTKGIKGEVKVTDITKEKNFPEVDLVLAYKVLDIIDKKGHANATAIVRLLETTHLLASFPTVSLSGKKMHTLRRSWFEKALRTNGYRFETFSSSNELFYLGTRLNKITSARSDKQSNDHKNK